MDITKHGKERIRKRCGIPSKSVERMAEIALDRGYRHAECVGGLKRYIDYVYLKERTANNIRVYGNFVYIFRDEILITVYDMPNHFRGMKHVKRKES